MDYFVKKLTIIIFYYNFYFLIQFIQLNLDILNKIKIILYL